MTITPELTLPTNSYAKRSFEHAVDVDLSDGTGEPVWQRIRFIDQVTPTATGVTVNAQTYEDLGAQNQMRVSENWGLSFGVQAHVINNEAAEGEGRYLQEVEALLARTAPDASGEAAKVAVRYYDNPSEERPPVLTDSYSGLATVEVTRGQTGANGELEMLNFTLTGVGRRAQTPHPSAA